jgi:membrane-associated protein
MATILLFTDTESLIRYGGLLLVFLFIFASTGFFFCFFLPSGAVLFTSGVLVASGSLPYDLYSLNGLLILASICGNVTGYLIGRQTGKLLYNRKDSRFFRRRHLESATAFYKRYGSAAITLGFFLPIIRSFAPVIAGIVRMDLRKFIFYSVIGSIAWIASFVLSGYFIAAMPILKPWLKYIVTGFLLVITLPLLLRIIREMIKPQKDQ